VEPTEHTDTLFNYVGLESIEGHTGNLLSYQPTPGAEIKSTKNVFRPGEILYGKLRPYLNKVHLASVDGICSTDIYVLRPRQSQVHPSFVANYLRSSSVLTLATNAMAGANLPRIAQDVLLAIPIPIPPLPLQREFAQRVTEIRELEAAQAASSQRLEALFQSMLHWAFEGEL
jgi:restriction endonuclease S subunit